MSRISQGKIALKKEPVDLARVIARSVETARPLIDARGQTLTCRCRGAGLAVGRLRAPVAGGVEPAQQRRQVHRRGRAIIELSAAPPRARRRDRVRDNGHRHRAAAARKVFELFVQGERALDRGQGGLGIGLTLVKRLVELHQGPRRGGERRAWARARVHRRRCACISAVARSRAARTAAPAAPSPRVYGRRVLVVDDNVDRPSSRGVPRLEGHEVKAVHDGLQALASLKVFDPHVVVLDIGLPGLDGYAVARQLRERGDSSHVLLIALTGYGRPVPQGSAQAPEALGLPAARRGARSGTRSCTRCSPGWCARARPSGRRTCCSCSSATASSRRPTSTSPTTRCASSRARSAACSASSPRPPARGGRARLGLLKDLAARNATAAPLPRGLRARDGDAGAKPQDTVRARLSRRRAAGVHARAEQARRPAAHAIRRAGRGRAPESAQAGGRPQPAARRSTTSTAASSRPGRRPAGHRDRQRARLRGGAQARRGARRDRPRQDRVLQQREPRVPHAAHADARAARGPAAQRRRVPPASREPLEVVHRNGRRLLKLVNTLLDFSRIEAGARRPSTSPSTSPRSPPTWPATSARRRAGRAGARGRLPAAGEPVYVDREMWEKIVLNLLSNAFKFTFEGEIERRAARDARQRRADGARHRHRHSRRRAAALFERFHRVEGARAAPTRAPASASRSCRSWCKLHGGTVDGRERRGRGSRRSRSRCPRARRTCRPIADRRRTRRSASSRASRRPFVEEALRWLPAARADGDAPTPAPGARRRRGARILVADDNADMREYVRRLLAERYEVEAAADGEAALAARARGRPIWC